MSMPKCMHIVRIECSAASLPPCGVPEAVNAAPTLSRSWGARHGRDRSSALEQESARALGERVARIATWLRNGRTEYEREHAPMPAASVRAAGSP